MSKVFSAHAVSVDGYITGTIEKSGGAAFCGGMLGHQFGWQVEIEIGKREVAHGA